MLLTGGGAGAGLQRRDSGGVEAGLQRRDSGVVEAGLQRVWEDRVQHGSLDGELVRYPTTTSTSQLIVEQDNMESQDVGSHKPQDSKESQESQDRQDEGMEDHHDADQDVADTTSGRISRSK